MTRLTSSQIAEIKAELAATTPGKWAMYDGYTTGNGVTYLHRIGTSESNVVTASDYDEISAKPADLEFIARAHNTHIPALLTEVERLRAVIGKLATKKNYTVDNGSIEDIFWLPSEDGETMPWEFAANALQDTDNGD